MGSACLDTLARIGRLRLRSSDGFSLMEVMMAMALTAVIMGASGTLLYSGQKTSNADSEDATAQSEAQGQLDRMVRDLSQATDVTTQNAGQITVTLLDGSQLSYKCDTADVGNSTYNACYRLTAAAGASLPAASAANEVMPRLFTSNPSSTPVFTYTLPTVDDSNDSDDEASDSGNTPDPPSPNYVAIHVELPAKGEATGGRARRIVLDSGVVLRNVRYAQTGGAGS
jgi:prepilin-type N-terminal cleavage/methylation domain-containing protein